VIIGWAVKDQAHVVDGNVIRLTKRLHYFMILWIAALNLDQRFGLIYFDLKQGK